MPWLTLQGNNELLRPFNSVNAHVHIHMYMRSHTHTQNTTWFLSSGKLEVFISRPEMLNVIQIFFLKTCHTYINDVCRSIFFPRIDVSLQ